MKGTLSYKKEFDIIDYICLSDYETRGVDAFSLALIKSERQLRKIFTFLIFQSPYFNKENSKILIKTLAKNKKIYSKHFIIGIDSILENSFESVYGELYKNDIEAINKLYPYRNKIFHGQISGESLKRSDLLEKIDLIKRWCQNCSLHFENLIGYDGFSRNSLRKSTKIINLQINIESEEELEKFIKSLLQNII